MKRVVETKGGRRLVQQCCVSTHASTSLSIVFTARILDTYYAWGPEFEAWPSHQYSSLQNDSDDNDND